MRKLTSVLSLVVAYGMGVSAVYAQPAQTYPLDSYLFDAVKKDQVLANEFAEIIKPLNTHFPWVANYGTATPAEKIRVNGKEYAVYQGCKPHNCPAESYVVVYSVQDKKMVAGAFVQNKYDQFALVESKVSWLGQHAADFAPTLGQYVF